MDGTAVRFAEVGARIDDLRREIGIVATLIRDLGQVLARQADENGEHRRGIEELRQYIRQVFSRMEQHDARMEQHELRFEAISREFRTRMAEHDARFEALSLDIRRILDALERRGGNGGGRGS